MARAEIRDTITDEFGRGVSDALVSVLHPDNTPATVYAGSTTSNVIVQPLKSHSGNIDGWVDQGTYKLKIVVGSATYYQVTEILSADAILAAIANGGSGGGTITVPDATATVKGIATLPADATATVKGISTLPPDATATVKGVSTLPPDATSTVKGVSTLPPDATATIKGISTLPPDATSTVKGVSTLGGANGAASLSADGLLNAAQRVPGVDLKLPGLILPDPSMHPVALSATAATRTVPVVYMARFVAPKTTTYTSFNFWMSTASTVDDMVDVGIYKTDGTRVGSNGGTTGLLTPAGRKTMTFSTPIPVTRGQVYYAAFASAFTTGGGGGFQAAGASTYEQSLFGQDMPNALWTQPLAAGNVPLPATLPTTVAGGLQTASYPTTFWLFPISAFIE